MILSQAIAKAVYDAMCALNNVGGTLDARIGAQTLGKGRGLGMGFECAAVEFERQPGHHLDLTLGP